MKKKCDIVKDLLPLYVDDVVSDGSKEFIKEHLKNCEECKNYLEGLKYNFNHNKNTDVGSFKKFIKKINFKIIKNSLIITGLIILITIPILYFIGNYEFINDYDNRMDILLLEGTNSWNFQFRSPISGYTYATNIVSYENGEEVNNIFINYRSTIQDYVTNLHGGKIGSGPDLNYQEISLNDVIRVYYTNENLKNVNNASEKELKEIINNSTLIFNNTKKTTKISCNLKGQEYSYTLTYYEKSGQIIDSTNDEVMPDKLLMDIVSSNKGEYKSLWFAGDKAKDIFKKTENYMINRGGSCTKEDVNF